MKRLFVMRHAKSDWSAGAANDHERPLNGRGTRAAGAMGRLLTEIGQVPELIISSSAVRARTTAELAARAGGWDAPIVVEPALYGTSPEGALRVVTTAPQHVASLMVIGHEPTWSGFVALLTGGAVQMKTATVAIIDVMVGGSWDIDISTHGELVTLLQPRHFAD